MDGETPVMPAPTEATHVFVRWDIAEQDGKLVYTAVWRNKNTYTFTVTLGKKLLDQNHLHAVDRNGNDTTVTASRNKTATVTVTLLEGNVSVLLKDNVLTISDGVNTYSIYATQITGTNQPTSNKRAIKYSSNSAVKDGTYAAADMSVNIEY